MIDLQSNQGIGHLLNLSATGFEIRQISEDDRCRLTIFYGGL